MKTTSKSQREIVLTPNEFRRLKELGFVAIPATLSQTLGPNWRHLFFVSPDGSKAKRERVHYYDVKMRPEDLYKLSKT